MWAGLILYQSKDWEQWVTSLSIDPRALEDSLYPQVFSREIGDRITVRRRSQNAANWLNTNPFFEVDAANWTVSGGTITRTTAQTHQGVASLLLTPDGITTLVLTRTENIPATVGFAYQVVAWVRCAVTRDVRININWRDAGTGLLSTTVVTATVTANTWTQLEAVDTAPASTAFAQLTVSMPSTPSASHLLYIDEAKLSIAPITRDSFIRGVSHSFGPGPNRWATRWALQSASKYTFFTIGNATTGKLKAYGIA
jgi:hypothetical protein